MCTSYGVDPARLPNMKGLPPLDERLSDVDLREWFSQHAGGALITGSIAKNLNPVVHVVDGAARLEPAWWSLPRPTGGPSFNARDDSLMRYWKTPFQHRGLLPATWYDEGKRRWTLPGEPLFWIAAITAPVEHKGISYLGYSMVTRRGVGEASTVVSARGDSRMPLVLPEGMLEEWLDPERPGDKSLVDDVQVASDEISRAMTAA